MKIIIDYEDKKRENIVYDDVSQFTLAGSMLRKKMIPANFRLSFISDANELIGMTETLKEDIKQHRDNDVKNTTKR